MALNWTIHDMIQVVSYGGSLDTSCKDLTLQEAIQLAGYAAGKGSKLILRGSGKWTAQEAIQIAGYGKGHVTFAD